MFLFGLIKTGKYYLFNGDIYEGEFKDGKFNGLGNVLQCIHAK